MWDENGKVFNTDPNEVLEERMQDWRTIWQCGSKVGRNRTNNATRVAIERAKVEGNRGALITSRKRIAETAATFESETSVGLALWAIKDSASVCPKTCTG